MSDSAFLAFVDAIHRRVQGPAVLPSGRPTLYQRIYGVLCPLCGKRDPWPYWSHGEGACMDCRHEAVMASYDAIERFRIGGEYAFKGRSPAAETPQEKP